MSAGASGPGDGTRAAEFDHHAAAFTFDALEKVIIQAVAADELEVAAEYVDTLFLLADQLDEFHEEYRSESQRLADRDEEISHEEDALEDAIAQVVRWASQADHPVAEWFQRGETA